MHRARFGNEAGRDESDRQERPSFEWRSHRQGISTKTEGMEEFLSPGPSKRPMENYDTEIFHRITTGRARFSIFLEASGRQGRQGRHLFFLDMTDEQGKILAEGLRQFYGFISLFT
jgi:hypothetical protein